MVGGLDISFFEGDCIFWHTLVEFAQIDAEV